MSNATEIENRDGPELLKLAPPVQRAAYSDRTAWQMAILAELAYEKFEKTPFTGIHALAEDLMKSSNTEDIVKKLLILQEYFKSPNTEGEARLKAVLKAAGFDLIGTFYNQTLDPLKNTEGYVAKYTGPHKKPFAVLAIRGTTSPQDWINNANVGLEAIGGGRKVHKGFHKAFEDAQADMERLLKGVKELPLYVTGHSLGGAVAVMATWYFSRDTLAACYTFGAPRVGNHAFNDGFKTPIYRTVNAFDPVPLVPPAGATVSFFKLAAKTIAKVFGAGLLDIAANWLTKIQGYRHAGYLRHMTAGDMDEQGRYPTVKYYTHFGVIDRFIRLWNSWTNGTIKRLDTYHNMTIYRRKLRSRALERAPTIKKP
jgi:hypothetical protein